MPCQALRHAASKCSRIPLTQTVAVIAGPSLAFSLHVGRQTTNLGNQLSVATSRKVPAVLAVCQCVLVHEFELRYVGVLGASVGVVVVVIYVAGNQQPNSNFDE
jgi:hypothetical protein